MNTLEFPQSYLRPVVSTLQKILNFDDPTKDYEYDSGIHGFSLTARQA